MVHSWTDNEPWSISQFSVLSYELTRANSSIIQLFSEKKRLCPTKNFVQLHHSHTQHRLCCRRAKHETRPSSAGNGLNSLHFRSTVEHISLPLPSEIHIAAHIQSSAAVTKIWVTSAPQRQEHTWLYWDNKTTMPAWSSVQMILSDPLLDLISTNNWYKVISWYGNAKFKFPRHEQC